MLFRSVFEKRKIWFVTAAQPRTPGSWTSPTPSARILRIPEPAGSRPGHREPMHQSPAGSVHPWPSVAPMMPKTHGVRGTRWVCDGWGKVAQRVRESTKTGEKGRPTGAKWGRGTVGTFSRAGGPCFIDFEKALIFRNPGNLPPEPKGQTVATW